LKELAARKSLSFTRMIKYFLIAFILVTIITIALLGFQGQHRDVPGIEFFGDMKRQDKVKFQKPSSFFADGRAARPPVDGAIPMGYDIPGHPMQNAGAPANDIDSPLGEFSAGTDYLNTGKMGDQWGTGLPLPVTAQLVRRGQREFTINCAVCHGATGQGNGITSKYGLLGIANYHQDKYREMPDGHIFDTISHGYNTMMAYGDKVSVKDRWAIIAYIRALQKSQYARIEDVPADQRAALESEAKPENTPQQNAPAPQQNVPGQPANTQTKQTR
jgi:mono/diheme cytochrome c family protein